ncbi:MAG: hypothetical protein ABH818_01390 [Patescibacteria group bacterium]
MQKYQRTKSYLNKKPLIIGSVFVILFLICLIYFLNLERTNLKEDLINIDSNLQKTIIALKANQDQIKTIEPIYNKYAPIEKAIQEVSKKSFSKARPSPCIAASRELKNKLQKLGIETEMVVGDVTQGRHQWIAIEIEPQTGELITTAEKYSALNLARNYYYSMPAEDF